MINVTKLNKMIGNVGSLSPVKIDVNGQTRLVDVSALLEKYNADKTQVLKIGITAEEALTKVVTSMLELSNPQLIALTIAGVENLPSAVWGNVDKVTVQTSSDLVRIYENTEEGKRGRSKSDRAIDEL